jgi:glycosyltransferase involved in cell wall biosynthesis
MRRVSDTHFVTTEARKAALIVASFPDSVLSFRGALISSIQQRGYRVHLAVPGVTAGSKLHQALVDFGLVVHDIPLRRAALDPLSDMQALRFLWQLMVSLGPQLVLSYTMKPVVYGSLAAWLAKVPHRFAIITGVGYVFTGQRKPWLTKMVGKLCSVALAKTDKVFFQNVDDLCLFRDMGILQDSRKTVVVNGSGVDLKHFSVAALPRNGARFLMIGRLLKNKGVCEYAEAAFRLRREYKDARFALAGWIDENPDAIDRRELRRWIDAGVIDFLGKLEDVRPAIESATVYVLPSYREGTPRTVLEAMAMGRAIITTDAPGCRETVINGENGYLVPAQSVDHLTEAMRRFIESADLAKTMGTRSRQIAEDKYDVRQVNSEILEEMGLA